MCLFSSGSCRKFAAGCIRSTAVFIAVWSMIGASRAIGAEARDRGSANAQALIDAASQAKANGNPGQAFALLHSALLVEPDNSLIRWQLGQVQVDGEWLTAEEAERRAAADPRQIEYQSRQAKVDDSPNAELSLARWCRTNKLNDEAAYYWRSILQVTPTNREALRALGVSWHNGQIQSPSEIRSAKEESTNTKRGEREWVSRVAEWTRRLSDAHQQARRDN
jgi:hypothetical protein